MDTGITYDKRCLLHKCISDKKHPESFKRISSPYNYLKKKDILKLCKLIKFKPISKKDLYLVHSKKYVKQIESYENKKNCYFPFICDDGSIDGDTFVMNKTFLAARLASGGLLSLCKKVLKNELKNGFSLLRPPGHHAQKDKASGFCIFNNASIAAKVCLKEKLAKNILIIDWDYHHGDGTENIFYNNDKVLFFSIHDIHNFPYSEKHACDCKSGKITDIGIAKGYNINVALNKYCRNLRDIEYIKIFEEILFPVIEQFKPDLIIISAGFDAVEHDPLGHMKITPFGFAYLLQILMNRFSKVVLTLEGGYNISQIDKCVYECVKVLLGQRVNEKKLKKSSKKYLKAYDKIIKNVKNNLKKYWKF